jgi:hypothetical protein
MLKYVCDACGKELAVSEGGVFQLGQQPPEWAIISLSVPQKRPYSNPVSLSYAEKALDEAREHLRKAFEVKDDTDQSNEG